MAENAIIVNALQRHATVVVQKSLREGFGLTVTEAMWKGRPVVASAVGGIQDQIPGRRQRHPVEGPDGSRRCFAEAVRSLLEKPGGRRAAGRGRRGERVREEFLGVRHLLQYAELIEDLDG